MKRGVKFIMALLLFFAIGCSKSDNPSPDNGMSGEELKLNLAKQFVYSYTKDAYLWSSRIPDYITYNSAATPAELLDMMMYKTLDKWSYVSENAEEEMKEFQGVSTTFGYSLMFYKFSNSEDVFAVVKFVYEGSPAQKAGLKRGDIILTLNGNNLTTENYANLYYSATVQIGMGKVEESVISPSGVSHSLVAVEMYEDPVLVSRVIDKGDKKIGYLAYAGFYAESHNKLVQVFNDFNTAGITDLVLDLRYNPGGNALTPPFLASLFAPASDVRGGKVFLKQEWNESYLSYFKKNGTDLNIYFSSDVQVNLNLSKVYVLTTSGTASASEATISGLLPYMDVVKIGTDTYGKYCAAALLTATDKDGKQIEEIKNWLLSLVVYKFVNESGYTDFVNGIPADYVVEDNLLATYPLGDEKDPHLAKAISLITGVESKVADGSGMKFDNVEAMPQLDAQARKRAYTMYDMQ